MNEKTGEIMEKVNMEFDWIINEVKNIKEVKK